MSEYLMSHGNPEDAGRECHYCMAILEPQEPCPCGEGEDPGP